MGVNNSLSDLCSRIKNNSVHKVKSILVIRSKKIIKVLDILVLEGFIRGYSFNTKEKNVIKVLLKYSDDGKPSIRDIKVISKSGKKVYSSVRFLWDIQASFSNGCIILSTSKGIMSLNSAIKNNLGGELLCYVA